MESLKAISNPSKVRAGMIFLINGMCGPINAASPPEAIIIGLVLHKTLASFMACCSSLVTSPIEPK